MAIKNFREDSDIKAVPVSAKPRPAVFERAEIKTMQKDLALIQIHLPQSEGLISKPKTGDLAKKKAPAPAPVEQAIIKAAKAPKAGPPQVAQARAFKIIETGRPAAPFVKAFFKAVFVVCFFWAFIAAVAYLWVMIRETDDLLSELPVSIKITYKHGDLPVQPEPAAPIEEKPVDLDILKADRRQEVVFSQAPDAPTIKAQVKAAQESTLANGEFLEVVLLDSERKVLSVETLIQSMSLPAPEMICDNWLSGIYCQGEARAILPLTDYAIYVYGEEGASPFGAVFKFSDELPRDSLSFLDPAWEQTLAVFLKSQGAAIAGEGPYQFGTAAYRGADVKYLNFDNGGALDLIYFPARRILAIATSKESAFRLIDRLMTIE